MDRGRETTTLDQCFKNIVHNADILACLLRTAVDEFSDCTIDRIKTCLELEPDGRTVRGRENEYFSLKHGSIITDSVFEATVPGTDDKVAVLVNVEGQYEPAPNYPLEKRAEYYMARLVSSQKGIDMEGSDYGNLRKTYSIWCVLNPRAEERNKVVRYMMKGEILSGDDGWEFPEMDTFNIVMINVGGYSEGLPDISAFPAVLFSRMGPFERQNLLKNRFKIDLDDNILEEVNRMPTLSEDAINGRYWKGRIEGRIEGREEGLIEATVKFTIYLVNEKGLSLDEAISISPISDSDRSTVEAEVRKELQKMNQ